MRLDTTSGVIVSVLTFDAAVADPATTSALRPFSYNVTLGNALSGICSGTTGPGWLEIKGQLADEGGGTLTEVFDLFDRVPAVPVSETWSDDRTQLTLAVMDRRLTAQDLICADVSLANANDERYVSSTFAFLFDGFARVDGDVPRIADNTLTDEIQFADRDLNGVVEERKSWKIAPRCKRVFRGTVSCSVKTIMRLTPGRPVLRLRGQMTYPQPYRERVLNPAFTYEMTGSLRWKSCPRRVSRKLAGQRCTSTVRWNGSGSLSRAFGRAR